MIKPSLSQNSAEQNVNLLVDATVGKDEFECTILIEQEPDFSNLLTWQKEILVQLLIKKRS